MKTIFITGCANGIGKHLAETFVSLNYQVIASDFDLIKLQQNSRLQHSEVLCLKLDVSKAEDWQEAIKKAVEKFKKIDISINNAGVITPNFLSDLSLQEIDLQLNVNLKGVMYGSKFAADAMIKQGFGHIINIASLAGVAPIKGLSVYAASKFGVRGFTLSIANEMKQKGIDVSVICPDLVDTNMLTLQLDYEAANLTFSGSTLSVNDIADAIINRAIKNKEVEILLPKSRGLLAKIGNFFPFLANFLTETLSKKGNKKRLALNNKS